MNADDIFKSYEKETISAEGLLAEIDGIECYGLCGEIEKINFLGKSIYKGINKAIFVDKNHDLSYYNPSLEYPKGNWEHYYVWGEFKHTGATDEVSGMHNTNMRISQSYSYFKFKAYLSFWDYVKSFRQMHSDRWFVPSKNELSMIRKVSKNLNDFSNDFYWSSTEYSSGEAYAALKKEPECIPTFKLNIGRVRLCVRF